MTASSWPSNGISSAWATGSRSARLVPFGALTPLLPPGRGGLDEGVKRLNDLLHRYLTEFSDRAAGRRFAQFVDDAHLPDDLSALLTYQAAVAKIAFVLVTIRTYEPIPDPVTALWKEGIADRIELRGVGNDAVSEMVTTVLGVLRPQGKVRWASSSELVFDALSGP